MNSLPPAVVVGYENNGMGVSRALSKCGIKCIGVAEPHWSPTWTSRTARVLSSPEWSDRCVVDLLLTIGRNLPEKAPLLITKDEPVIWVSQQREELGRYYEINLPPHEIVARLMNKQAFTESAIQHGWPVPKSWTIQSANALNALIGDIVFPCILKPAVKNSAFRQNSPHKALKAHTARELIDHYSIFAQWESDAIIQEWIQGGDERIAFALGYWNHESEPVAVFAGRKLRQWPPECGNTALAAPAPMEWRKQMVDLTKEIYREFGFRGLGSIEYKVRDDGRLVITEPTVGRTNYQNEIAVINGTNLPAIAYFSMLGRSIEVGELVRSASVRLASVKLVDGMADYRAARHYMKEGKLTMAQWLTSRSGPKRYFVLRLSDPLPFVASIAGYLASKVRAVVRRTLKKIAGSTT